MKYIDADRLRAAIKEHTLFYAGQANLLDGTNTLDGYDEVLAIIDSLQQEQPEVFDTVAFQKGVAEGRRLEREEPVTDCHDLEEEMEKFGERWPYPASFDGYDKDWVDELAEECAKHFYELGKKDMKRKMMEGAVEGVVNHGTAVSYVISDEDQLDERLKQFQNDAEVRIIILPKED